MKRILDYTIGACDRDVTVLDFLREKGYSRHMLTGFKAFPETLLLNGERPSGRTLLREGDLLRVALPQETSPEKILPVEMDLSILYEDEDCLVIDKPADTPVHPSQGNYENTLANGVAWYYQSRGESCVFRCINRLDRDTTGVVLLAKNALSASVLSSQMKQRQIRRTYLALAEGITPERGIIDEPIARAAGSTILREVRPDGERAVTAFERLAVSNGLSLLELHLATGRTHQIRVHMKHIGHPLIGDFLYYPEMSRIRRQALHSYRLEFRHPVTGAPLSFQAPIPEDFLNAFYPERRDRIPCRGSQARSAEERDRPPSSAETEGDFSVC